MKKSLKLGFKIRQSLILRRRAPAAFGNKKRLSESLYIIHKFDSLGFKHVLWLIMPIIRVQAYYVNRHVCRSFKKHKKILFRKSVLAQTAKTLAAFLIYGYIPDYHNKKFRPIRFYFNITFDFFIVKRFWAHTQKNRAEKARLVHYSSSAVPSLSSISSDTVTKLYPLSLSSGRITFSASGVGLPFTL